MGNNVVINPQTGEANQRFVFEPNTMTIQTLNQSGKSLNIASNGRSTNLEVNSTNGQWW
jgi:hypothetical protein